MASSISGRKLEEWQRRLRKFSKSRQSIAAFCRQEGIWAPSFYFWRKRLLEAGARTQGASRHKPRKPRDESLPAN